MKQLFFRVDLILSHERQITIYANRATGAGHAFERIKRGPHWLVVGARDVQAFITEHDNGDAQERIVRGMIELERDRDPARSLLEIAHLRFRAAHMQARS